MSDVRARLLGCFAAVFPTLSEETIPGASIDSIESWDSLTSAILISTIEEEFDIQVSLDDIERFVSFDRVLNYLQDPQLQDDT